MSKNSDSFFLILGNQLFPLKHLKKHNPVSIFMAEDFGLCTHFKYHKQKIIFFLTAMRDYRDQLIAANFKVDYYDANHELFEKCFENKLDDFLKSNPKKRLQCFEIEDLFFEKRIKDYCKEKALELEILPTPMFLTSRKEFKNYLDANKKPFMKTFYERQRKQLSIFLDEEGKPIGGKWSFDSENRKKLKTHLLPPPLPIVKTSKNLPAVINFVDFTFKSHPGESQDFWLPTNRKQSLKWLDTFIEERMKNFGDYQDAITQSSDFVYHSVLSPMINAGLLTPEEIIKKLETASGDKLMPIPINSMEGFIRQLIGWREFVRGIYQNFNTEEENSNFFNHKRKLKDCWYDGTTGLSILDDTIRKTLTYAYNHHIERLMILSNLMLLTEIHPKIVYSWFMQMFSDSSDWVMGPNVYGMGQFSDGGLFATKPYICGSNYYLKMSDYKKGEWCDSVDGLYWRFINKNRDFYKKNPRMSFVVNTFDKMKEDRKQKILKAADTFIEKVSYL